jgi:hypothetical protein
MFFKRHLRAKVLRIPGGHASAEVLKSIEDMTEKEAEQWYRLLSYDPPKTRDWIPKW